MTPDVLKLADQLATAEQAHARMQETGPRRANAPRRLTPKCEQGCAVCWLECAVIYACVEDIRQRLEAAMGEAAAVLSHGGRFYVAAIGRA